MTRVVVLLPGLGNTDAVFAAQTAALSAEHRLVVAEYAGAASIEAMAERVLAQVPGERLALVGYSLGGYVALQMVRGAAERIERLALLGTSSFADSDAARARRTAMIAQARVDYARVLDDIGRFAVFGRGPQAAQARRQLVEMGLALGMEAFCRQQWAAMHRMDTSEVLASVRCPVRMLCGLEDRVTPVEVHRAMLDRAPSATLEVVADAGHLLPLEKPEPVTAFLRDWLAVDAG